LHAVATRRVSSFSIFPDQTFRLIYRQIIFPQINNRDTQIRYNFSYFEPAGTRIKRPRERRPYTTPSVKSPALVHTYTLGNDNISEMTFLQIVSERLRIRSRAAPRRYDAITPASWRGIQVWATIIYVLYLGTTRATVYSKTGTPSGRVISAHPRSSGERLRADFYRRDVGRATFDRTHASSIISRVLMYCAKGRNL